MELLKKYLGLVIVFLLTSSVLVAQDSPVTIEPQQPEPGDMVTITYHPDHPNADIKSAEEMFFVKNFAPTLYNIPKKVPLEKTKDRWQIQIQLVDKFDFATFYVKSEDQVDKNTDDQHYELIAYQEGKPVKGVFLLKSYILSDRYEDLSDSAVTEKRIKLYRKELKHHPDNYDAKIRLTAHKLYNEENSDQKAELRQKAYKIINDRLQETPRSYSVLQDVKMGYKLIGEKTKGDSLESELIKKYPDSDIAMLKLYEKTEQEKHFKKKLEQLERFVRTDFEPSTFNKYNIQEAYKSLIKYYTHRGEFEKAKKAAAEWLQDREPLFDKQILSENYLAVAQIFLEHENLIDPAMDYARQALKQTDTDPAKLIKTNKGYIPRQLSDDESTKFKEQRKGDILSTIAQIYTKKGEYKRADKYLNKAQNLSDSRTVKKYLANYYLHKEQPKAAFDIYKDILMKIPTDTFYQKKLKEAYMAFNGSEDGFGKETQAIHNVWEKKKRKELNKNRIGKEAPEFDQITDLEGNPVDLTQFEKKVLVIDFWATWCKPCLEIFPYLQNVYEKYKDHPEVEFLILNSRWNNTLEKAKSFSSENDYTFPYYFDKNSSTTEAFEIRALPTTVFVDKSGTIQFKKMGLRGNNIEKTVSLRIEMLLDKNKDSSNTNTSK